MRKILLLQIPIIFLFNCTVTNNNYDNITVMNRTSEDLMSVEFTNYFIGTIKANSSTDIGYKDDHDSDVNFTSIEVSKSIITYKSYNFKSDKTYNVKIYRAENDADMVNILNNKPQDVSILTADYNYYVEIYENK